MKGQTKLSALALPLALLALLQVGSCGGGARGGGAATGGASAVQNTSAKRNAATASNANSGTNKNSNTNANADAEANANAGASANANARGGAKPDAASNANRDRDEREDGPSVSKEGGAGEGVAQGSWGGRGAQLDVDADGARIEFDCAHGRIERLGTDADGRFDVRGVLVAERGGPARIDEKEVERPARYTGKIEGETMTLTVTPEGDEAGAITYTLTRGRGGRLFKCR
ncbi:MAG TPA: hypothetical protein VFX96_00245 [Pyrinomonadaceae bacterium]|nr:hypothetical protein [Pyrinomonadaceae bacterium]